MSDLFVKVMGWIPNGIDGAYQIPKIDKNVRIENRISINIDDVRLAKETLSLGIKWTWQVIQHLEINHTDERGKRLTDIAKLDMGYMQDSLKKLEKYKC